MNDWPKVGSMLAKISPILAKFGHSINLGKFLTGRKWVDSNPMGNQTVAN